MKEFFEGLPPSQDVNILLQHIAGHRCELPACDGAILLQPGAGIPQGSPIATDAFNQIYWQGVNLHEAEMAKCNASLVGRLQHDTQWASVATTVFVDDITTSPCLGKCSSLQLFWTKPSTTLRWFRTLPRLKRCSVCGEGVHTAHSRTLYDT